MPIMPESDPVLSDTSFLAADPIHPQGPAFLAQVQGMLDGKPKEAEAVQKALTGYDDLLEKMAGDLYHLASMLVGEGEETISLIEKAVATADIPACCDHLEARHSARVAMAVLAIERVSAREQTVFTAPKGEVGPVSCIEDDDLSAAGVTAAELEVLLNGPDRQRLRTWLECLGNPLRVIFVLRAVAGLSSPEVAGLLSLHGGQAAKGWTPDAVRDSFRGALCSLTSQMIQASAAR
jgi:hypothetical protein